MDITTPVGFKDGTGVVGIPATVYPPHEGRVPPHEAARLKTRSISSGVAYVSILEDCQLR